jgi:hypothetical protein
MISLKSMGMLNMSTTNNENRNLRLDIVGRLERSESRQQPFSYFQINPHGLSPTTKNESLSGFITVIPAKAGI